jgi:hypothetical protein
MQTFKLLYARWRAETPKFWKKIVIKGAILGTVATGIAQAPDEKFVPEIVKKIAQDVAFVAYGISIAAKCTTNEPEISEKQ